MSLGKDRVSGNCWKLGDLKWEEDFAFYTHLHYLTFSKAIQPS